MLGRSWDSSSPTSRLFPAVMFSAWLRVGSARGCSAPSSPRCGRLSLAGAGAGAGRRQPGRPGRPADLPGVWLRDQQPARSVAAGDDSLAAPKSACARRWSASATESSPPTTRPRDAPESSGRGVDRLDGSRGLGPAAQRGVRIQDEHTRQPAENPVPRVLRDGRIVGLANHTLLVTRDGRETPIDDSAAPIRTPTAALPAPC